ncbi:MAG: murein biosynthesis integral membrane protein MurJ [Alphaproteobacteria bacterium]|nr:MAG: murein biosynthesis integral membrane protein MurJ [Alphaproteobacteria bacterium]
MSLFKNSAVVAAMTMISRVLGFVRDILIARFLGIGPIADAFFYAFTFPNLFRRLFGEGAFNSAFVPLYAKKLEGEGEEAARRFSAEALAVLLLSLVILTLVAEIFMPALILLIAPGFADTPEKFELTVLFTRISFPYLLFVSLVALQSGILNSRGKFAAAAAAPILLNIVLITALMTVRPWFETTGHLLSFGVAIAGIAQFIVLAVACQRLGALPRLPRPRLTPDVRRLIRLGVPGAIAGGITQINLVVGGIIASLEDGARAILYYADRLYQLPLGVIGVALGVALLPELSRRLRAGDGEGVERGQNRALEIALYFTLPAAVALFAMPQFLITALFERGAFDTAATEATAAALRLFALGLPAFVLIKVFSPAFFAREDTKTPMRYAAVGVAVNIGVSLALFWQIGFLAIALATTLSGWVNAGLLWRRLSALEHFTLDSQIRRSLPKMALASLAMGLLVAVLAGEAVSLGDTSLVRIAALGIIVALGLGLYITLTFAMKAVRVPDLKAAFSKRGG